MRGLVKGLGVTAAAIGAMIFASGPASADVIWQPWVAPSDYVCFNSKTHDKSDYVAFQTCIVHGSGRNLQAVLIVSNTSDKKITIYGQVFAGWDSSGDYSYCRLSDLSPGARTSCFGATSTGKVGANTAYSYLYMNGQSSDDATQSNVVTYYLS
ncbi:hypothetical protein BM536_034105 [Streptomyces phaeoluteigriseus]|uniref:Secreted protein n=1 Tax=Streptomyces phaeoluteigriseus TaxID=114686 RepID=A0A1V6ML02_9ACTN|nr:hypothetical protein [Streptomyces phaeoluteigriseus]OQD53046.1 hypothetical protein BM536_034105 [Streptomyces phaeoluteigriseus]